MCPYNNMLLFRQWSVWDCVVFWLTLRSSVHKHSNCFHSPAGLGTCRRRQNFYQMVKWPRCDFTLMTSSPESYQTFLCFHSSCVCFRWVWRKFWVSAQPAAAVWPLTPALDSSLILQGKPRPFGSPVLKDNASSCFFGSLMNMCLCVRCVIVLLHPKKNKQTHIINTCRYVTLFTFTWTGRRITVFISLTGS